MELRMMRYYTDIKFITTLPVKQYLIYIGKEKLRMNNYIKDFDFTYKYNIIDTREIDCEKFIEIDTPESLVLSILCDFKGKEQEIITYIIKRLREKTKNNDKLFREYMLMLEELSENRDLKDKIIEGEKMLTEINYEKLPSFEIGLEAGMKRGLEQGLKQGLEQGLEQGIQKAIKGIYIFEKNPKKIASILEIDEEMVNKTIKRIENGM
jgi:hypothetical protein